MLNLIIGRNLSSVSKPYFLQFHSFSSLISIVPDSDSRNGNPDPFTVKYLTDRFGFSREWAAKACPNIRYRSCKNPDLVIAFFRKHGFSDSHIKRMVKKSPVVLALKPQDNLSPKIEYFRSLGISPGDVVKIVTTARCLMSRSLENQIMRSFNFIKNMLKSEKDAIYAIKRFPTVLEEDLSKYVPLNAEILRKAGVPENNILYFFKIRPRALLLYPDEFNKFVERVIELEFSPVRTNFIMGISVMRMLSESSWNKKMEAYKAWGYSEDHILLAFRRSPMCMLTSRDKIDEILGYIINKMGCDPLVFVTFPTMMSLSLKSTIIPRCLVYQVLKSKGLLKTSKKANITGILKHSKDSFAEKFVLPFVDEVPELRNLYPCNLNPPKVCDDNTSFEECQTEEEEPDRVNKKTVQEVDKLVHDEKIFF